MKSIGTHGDGSEIGSVTLQSETHRIEVITHGARVTSWKMGDVDIFAPLGGLDELSGKGVYHAAIIAPVANRIGGAAATLDGRRLHFQANEGRNCLHSGDGGSQGANWAIAESSPDTVRLTLKQRDGTCGFPGNRIVSATFRLSDDTLELLITGKTDAPTFFNPAFHPYLSAPGGSTLQLASDRVVETDAAKIPTGRVLTVAGGNFDFSAPRVPSSEIDHCFEISRDIERPAALLSTPDFDLSLRTDAPGLQVYTGRPGVVALEPEIHPDAPNHPQFPRILLQPGETFRQRSLWTVSKK